MPDDQKDQTATPFAHSMLREIYEQPAALAATLDLSTGSNGFGDSCEPLRGWLRAAQSGIVIAASGSSRHAGLIAELLLEDRGGIAVDVEYASEYIYRPQHTPGDSAMLVISQSGETADTLAALRKARRMGRPCMAITNVPGSSMGREADVSYPTAAGTERAIPATKSFTTQVLNLYLLSLLAGELRGGLDPSHTKVLLDRLRTLPALIAAQLPTWDASARRIAAGCADAGSFLFAGRGIHYPIAREAALKLKESAYLHAEGYPGGELKHGPRALLGERTPLVMLAARDTSDPGSVERYGKTLQLLADMRRQGARIVAIANTGDTAVQQLVHEVIFVEETQEELLALCEIVPLQLFAYHMAIGRGIDVDRPRNLTKAVLTE